MPKVIKIPLITLTILVGLLLLSLGIAQTYWFKNELKKWTVTYLEKKLGVEVHLQQIEIEYLDQIIIHQLYVPDLKNDTLVYLEKLSVNYNIQSLFGESVSIDKLNLTRGSIYLGIHEGDKSLNIQYIIDAFSPKSSSKKTPQPFIIKDLTLNQTSFNYFNKNYPAPKSRVFNENNMIFSQINGVLHDFYLINDSLHFSIDKLTTKEKSGLIVQNIRAETTISSTTLKLTNLELKTPKSTFKDSVVFLYSSYTDFDDFNNKVDLHFNLKNSVIHTDDLAFFSNDLKETKKQINVHGSIHGFVNQLISDQLRCSMGESFFDGKINLQNITQIEKLVFEIKAKKIITNPNEIERYSQIKDLFNDFKMLDNIEFSGALIGSKSKLDIDGICATNLGKINTKLSLGFPNNNPINYQGYIRSDQLALGNLIANESIGTIDFDITLEGSGNSLVSLITEAKGNIFEITYQGITYQNIKLNASISNQIILADFESREQDYTLLVKSETNLQNEQPKWNANIDIQNFPFKLNYPDTNHRQISCSGEIDITGNSIDELDGNIQFQKITYEQNGKKYPFNHVGISKKTGVYQEIKLTTDEFEANISGQYVPTEIPVILNELNGLWINHEKKKLEQYYQSKDFNLHITLIKPNQIIPLMWDNIKLDKGSFNFSYNLDNHKIQSNHSYEGLKIGNISSPKISAKIQNIKDTNALNYAISTKGVLQNDSNIFDIFELSGTLTKDVLFFRNTTQKGEDLAIHIDGRAIYQEDSAKIYIDKSKVLLNQKPWTLKPVNTPNIILHQGITEFLYFDFRHDDEILFLDASMGSQANKVNAIISNFKLENINPFIAGYDLNFHGIINGYIDVSDRNGFPIIETDLSIDDLQMDDDTLGHLELNSINADGLAVSINGNLSGGVFNKMEINGSIDFANQNSPLNLELKTQKSSIKPFQKYLAGLMSDIHGYSNTRIFITGPLTKPELKGKLTLDSLSFVMDYLNTEYKGRAIVAIDYSSFNITEAYLIDHYGKRASLSGKISHHNFDDIRVDLAINDLNNFEILNTSKGDNELFYGHAFVDGNAKIYGPIDDIMIQANAKSRKGTIIEIPLEDASSDHMLSYVKFVNQTKNIEENTRSQNETGVQMDFNFEITNDAEVKLIFDELLGDKIEASGHGNLRMEVNTFGDFNMYGGLTIDKGNYLFTAFDLINKYFIVKPGGTLFWNGNPYNAKISLEAIKREYPTPYPLMQGSLTAADDSAAFQTAIAADCYLKLEGLLFNPEVTFDLNFPTQTNLNSNSSSSLNTIINRIRLDQEELNRQVFALLVLGTFIPPSFANNAGPNLSEGAVNTGINSFSDFASSQINNWLGQLDTRFQLGVDYQTSYQNKAELILSLQRKFLNDRLELAYSTDAAATGAIPYDISVKYAISEDGNLKVIGFQKQANDPTLGNITNVRTTGIGLFYRYQFDRFRFRRKKKFAP